MKFLKQLRMNELFTALTDDEIDSIFVDADARIVKKAVGKIIALPNDIPQEVAIVISGNVVLYVVKSDGQKEVVNSIVDGAMFGMENALTGTNLGYYAATARDTELLYINVESLMSLEPNAAVMKLYSALAKSLSGRIIRLENNNDYITTKGMRKKIAKLIFDKYLVQNSFELRLGMDRNQMAKFLNVSRPSMSREMIRMREEGIIQFHKDAIRITDIEKLKKILGSNDD